MVIKNFMKEYLLIYLLVINVLSFLIFFIDKRRAKNRQWRISESFLMGLAIIGGSIGSMVGMKVFHHKTKKIKFKIGLPLIFLVNLGMIYWLLR